MGRAKIPHFIKEERQRSLCFNKRKTGMQKKCLELSTLTECEVAMIIIYKGKLYQYASSDMDQLMLRYSEGTAEPQESRTNVDVGESRLLKFLESRGATADGGSGSDDDDEDHDGSEGFGGFSSEVSPQQGASSSMAHQHTLNHSPNSLGSPTAGFMPMFVMPQMMPGGQLGSPMTMAMMSPFMQHAQSPTAAFLNDSFPGTFDTNQFVSDDNTEGPRRNSNPVGVTGASATGTSADPQSPTNYLVAFSPVATGAQLPWPAAAVTAASLAPTSSSSPRRLSFSYVPVAMGGTAIGGGMSSMAKPAVAATSSVSPGKRTHDDSEATEPPLTLATPGAMAVSPKRGRANK